jgi:hypothetical protein
MPSGANANLHQAGIRSKYGNPINMAFVRKACQEMDGRRIPARKAFHVGISIANGRLSGTALRRKPKQSRAG